jgi:hypothetical protein
MQQQQEDFMTRYKRNFNIAYNLMLVHQRAIIIPMRERYGKEVFGSPCALAFLLMCAWAALSMDAFMWLWVGVWLFYLARRKDEAVRLANSGARIHSQYDGWPLDANRYGCSENVAKLVVEPVLVGAVGIVLFMIYQEAGLPVYGLPYFFMLGLVTLPFVEKVKQLVWERRIQGINDARIEQEALVRESRERYGE